MKKKLIIYSLIVLVLDLISKYIVSLNLYVGEKVSIIKNFFSIENVHNYGAAFSSFSGYRILLISISVIILCYLIYMIKSSNVNKLQIYSYSLIIGGLVGNLFDRIFFGYVRDFLSFKIFSIDFAIFNIADSAIVLGVILFIINECVRSSKKCK